VGSVLRVAGVGGEGAGLENQTCAGTNFQVNVCYNKKRLLSYFVVPAWIAHALICKPMPYHC